MRKTKTVHKKIKEVQTVDILCNKCAKSCFHSKKDINPEGLIEVEVSGGYDSKVIGDLITWRFSLCESCLSSIVDTFKIPVEIKDHELHDFLRKDKVEKFHKKMEKQANKKAPNQRGFAL